MASGGEKPPDKVERIGRGAALLAAYKSKLSKPTSSSSSEDEQGKGSGRASLLQNIIAGRGRAITAPVATEGNVKECQPPAMTYGRGALPMGRAKFLTSSSSSSPSTSDAAPLTPSESHAVSTPSPPTAEFEKLSIGQYSGTGGKLIDLEVNYLRLKTTEGEGVYEYHVSFNPLVDSKSMKFRLISQPEVKAIIGLVRSFDGAKLYLPRKLNSEISVPTKLPTDGSEVIILIKFVGRTRPRDMLHLYNVLFHRIMNILKMVQIGRNYFDPQGNIPVPQHRLEIWPGYITAVQEYEGGVMLNADSSFRVLRSVTARDVLLEATGKKMMKDEICRLLVGSVVLTRYNNKNYRIDDISWDSSPMSSFDSRDGTKITFMDYYKRAYDITISDKKQPLLISQSKKKNPEDKEEKMLCLIPELCNMTGLTDEMRSDHRMMRDIATHTRVTPGRRQMCFKKFIENISMSPEATKVLKDWNLELDDGLLSLNGRLLDSEKIMVKNNSFVVSSNADWGRQITTNHCLVSINLENWFVVYVKRDAAKANDFISMMKKVCPDIGIRINHPSCIELTNDRTDQYCTSLRQSINPKMQVAVIIFPNPRDDRYSAVKKVCCIEKPIPSQCINVRTISQFQKLRSVTQKIALQINCKLGGELWALPIPLENIMVCGMDSYHDAAQRNQSILGFVASTSRNLTRWFSKTAMQKAGQELGDALKVLFLSALRKYHEINHRLPQRIFIFRDGVGDGMLDVVRKYEVEQFVSCFPNIQMDYKPTLSVIVVQKRINTRMYFKQDDQLSNPPPGSVLDHSVTRKNMYDFFLVSQHVGQGTVSPTHFIVVHDENKLKPGQMQKLSYKMTHLYYNWPGTVRVPAPCQYAHKLAYLVGQNLHKEAHEELSDRLFYL